jgi:hypothetical protein
MSILFQGNAVKVTYHAQAKDLTTSFFLCGQRHQQPCPIMYCLRGSDYRVPALMTDNHVTGSVHDVVTDVQASQLLGMACSMACM